MPQSRQYSLITTAAFFSFLSTILLLTSETDLDDITGIIVAYEACRLLSGRQGISRGPYDASHSEDFLENLLHKSTDRRFKAYFRVDRTSFTRLNDLIKNHDVFISTGKRPQRPSWYQLAVFLLRYGLTHTEKAAEEASIAEGTVYLYCMRVAHAFRHIRPQFLTWPDIARRAVLKARMGEDGFPGCIGMIDGTLIPLAIKPVKDGELYFCRKKFYAVILQAVCDDTLRFLEFDLGWPGNVQDSTVFRESGIWRRKGEHFQHDEFLLADKGYPLTKFTIRPFTDSDLTNDENEAHRRRNFNFKLSHLRICIEHSFGMLKDLGDDPTLIEDYDGVDELAQMQDELEDGNRQVQDDIDNFGDVDLYRTGLFRRKALLNLMDE
ncbi:hypothetical protein A7U60_g5994 [Sanghuangporus baumii]|uniref:DDE Tnp4 domain-containing protein n=1 Tax=Sanghuangporus baumii TaxID=108892 RepID=A0A9Q5N7A2_SANBA|nr:hypothetical protein A7U60_g5994 [Sanghuangporus baumii]